MDALDSTDTPQIARHFGQVLAVSPHLDDAVFSCGALLATCRPAVVATIFAGEPEQRDVVTPWDASCGFVNAHHAIQARRQEDKMALGILGARPIHLPFLDAQYGNSPHLRDIRNAVHEIIVREKPETVLIPLGLFHSDHILVAEAMMSLRQIGLNVRWVAYEDALYRRKPGLLHARLEQLRAQGIGLTFLAFHSHIQAFGKARAVAAYASQLHGVGLLRNDNSGFAAGVGARGRRRTGTQGLRIDGDTAAPEGYWLLD
nr:PIG-L family deacetylase [Pseudomonas sp.]